MNGLTKIVMDCFRPFSGSMCNPKLSALNFWGSEIWCEFFADSFWNTNSFLFQDNVVLCQGLINTKLKHCFALFSESRPVAQNFACTVIGFIWRRMSQSVLTSQGFSLWILEFIFNLDPTLRDAKKKDKNIYSRNSFYISANHLWIRCTSENITKLYVRLLYIK